jgi:hypothetical protein
MGFSSPGHPIWPGFFIAAVLSAAVGVLLKQKNPAG